MTSNGQKAGNAGTAIRVFDADEVREMVKRGVQKLGEMQLSDGG